MSAFYCNKCNLELPSRNKLFKHIRLCGVNEVSTKKQKRATFDFEQNKSAMPEEYCTVFVLGGRLRGRTLSAVHCYSVNKKEWSMTVPMLQNRGSHGAACVDGILYSIGGGGLHSNLDACEAFDGESWSSIPALLTSRHALAVTSHLGKIYAVGGWVNGSKCSDAVEVYVPSRPQKDVVKISEGMPTQVDDTNADRWMPLPPLNHARRLHGVAACCGKLYVFGGCCDDPHWYTDSVEVLDLRDESTANGGSGNGWTELPARVPFAGELSAVSVEPFIFLFLNGKGVVRYDPADDTHTQLSDLPVEDWHCFDTVHIGGGHVMVLGGTSKGVWTTAAFDYDVRLDEWTQLPSMTQAKRRAACTALWRREDITSSSTS